MVWAFCRRFSRFAALSGVFSTSCTADQKESMAALNPCPWAPATSVGDSRSALGSWTKSSMVWSTSAILSQ
ncbi:MAG: hypothetical protein BWY88_00390 [Synergistetes bacterium ADurb.Bin520]|nr:MAG: hypothetical protein BWY88_00390 [Synergistetes bacterium ADurb.Bin520]